SGSLFRHYRSQSIPVRAWKTCMVVCRCDKTETISTAQPFIYHISWIPGTHIVVIRIIRILTPSTAVLGKHFHHRRNVASVLVPVDTPVSRSISDMERDCNRILPAVSHQFSRRRSVDQRQLIVNG